MLPLCFALSGLAGIVYQIAWTRQFALVFGTTETAIEATKWGAFDYVPKPFEVEELLDLTARALESSRLMSEPVEMGDIASARTAIVGKSRVMQAIYKEIGHIAATPVSVLFRAAPREWRRS